MKRFIVAACILLMAGCTWNSNNARSGTYVYHSTSGQANPRTGQGRNERHLVRMLADGTVVDVWGQAHGKYTLDGDKVVFLMPEGRVTEAHFENNDLIVDGGSAFGSPGQRYSKE